MTVIAGGRRLRADTLRVTLTINGEDWGFWGRKTGGKLDSDNLTTKPGNMAPAVSLGGSKSSEPIVLQRNYTEVDNANLQKLINGVGNAACVVKEIPLDTDGNAFGKTVTTLGTLKSMTRPDYDSTSNAEALLEIEITPDSDPVAI